jgi:hypothetical protein
MIKTDVKTEFNQKALTKHAWRRATPPLQQAASTIARSAKASIKKSAKKYSQPGQPPNTRGQRRSLKKSIMYYVDKKAGWAIIGPSGYVTGQTGHFHEFGGAQSIKGKRHKYELGSVGPIDTREGYVTKQGRLKKGAPRLTATGVVFAKLKTQRMVQEARKIDRTLWPDAEKWHKRIYPKRPFMWPAAKKNWRNMTKIFADATA